MKNKLPCSFRLSKETVSTLQSLSINGKSQASIIEEAIKLLTKEPNIILLFSESIKDCKSKLETINKIQKKRDLTSIEQDIKDWYTKGLDHSKF